MLVGTWNVGGKPPKEGLDMRDWLNSPTPIDIYVLGYSLFLSLACFCKIFSNFSPSM